MDCRCGRVRDRFRSGQREIRDVCHRSTVLAVLVVSTGGLALHRWIGERFWGRSGSGRLYDRGWQLRILGGRGSRGHTFRAGSVRGLWDTAAPYCFRGGGPVFEFPAGLSESHYPGGGLSPDECLCQLSHRAGYSGYSGIFPDCVLCPSGDGHDRQSGWESQFYR